MYHAGVINRAMLKDQSKDWIKRAVPAAWLVALVYQLVTSVLPWLVQSVLPAQEQLTRALEVYENGEFERAWYLIRSAFSDASGIVLIFVIVVFALLNAVIDYGYSSYALGVVRGENPGVGEVFSRFYMAGKIILAELLRMIYIFLWSLLFVIPGFVAAYRYSMVSYILLDDPDCSVFEAFRRSKQIMHGRKWEYFCLEMSFFLWIMGSNILSGLPYTLLGETVAADVVSTVIITVYNLYLLPYKEFTSAGWYEAVRPREGADQQTYHSDPCGNG